MAPVLLFVFGTYLKVPPLDKNYQKFHQCNPYGEVRNYSIENKDTDDEDIWYDIMVTCKDTSMNRFISQKDLLILNRVPK